MQVQISEDRKSWGSEYDQQIAETQKEAARLDGARIGERRAYFGECHGWLDTPVYDRDRVPTGARFRGPALLEEMSSTTVVGAGQDVEVDAYGNLIIHLQGGSHA